MQETQEMRVPSLGQENHLEKGMTTHSSIFAWRILWTEELEGLQSMGSQRVKHNWRDLTHKHKTGKCGTHFFLLECWRIFRNFFFPVFQNLFNVRIFVKNLIKSYIIYSKPKTFICLKHQRYLLIQCFFTLSLCSFLSISFCRLFLSNNSQEKWE